MMARIFPLFSLFLLTAVFPLRAQDVQVLGSVDATTIGAEETVTFSIEVQGGSLSSIRTPQPPQTEGLTLLNRIPSTSRNVSIVNGAVTQSIGFRWSYRPIQEGTARISRAEIVIGDRTYRTEPIQIDVVPQAQRPQRQARRDPFGNLLRRPYDDLAAEEKPEVSDTDVFIRALPSAREAYQNEQIGVEYRLYFREGIQLRQSRLADSWDAEGFWREELDVEPRPVPQTVVENGLRYNMITLKRVAVFPTHAGELAIDPLRIESEGYVPRRSRDPFRNFFSLRDQYQSLELASPRVRVDAKPLPANAPASFTGAVGSFEMNTRVDRTEVEVGEAVQVTINVSGTGNIATLELPDFEAPGIFEVYDPEVTPRINRTGNRVRGTKTFSYLLVPRQHGTFTLPQMRFSYLDPRTDSYETLTSEPITIRVTGTATVPETISLDANGLPVDDITDRALADAPRWVATGTTPLYQRWWPYLALVLPLLVVAGVYGYQRHALRLATDPEYARNRKAHPLARKHLKKAEALLAADQARAFYEALERAVLGFVGNRLNLAEKGMTRPVLDAKLGEAHVPDDLRDDLRTLLEECDRVRFAPVPPNLAAMRTAHQRAARLIVALDEAFRAPQPAPVLA